MGDAIILAICAVVVVCAVMPFIVAEGIAYMREHRKWETTQRWYKITVKITANFDQLKKAMVRATEQMNALADTWDRAYNRHDERHPNDRP